MFGPPGHRLPIVIMLSYSINEYFVWIISVRNSVTATKWNDPYDIMVKNKNVKESEQNQKLFSDSLSI